MQGLAFAIQKTLLRSSSYYSTGNQPHKIQWLLHVYGLDTINIVKVVETTRGNGRKQRGDNSNEQRENSKSLHHKIPPFGALIMLQH
jgi:CRISPR/Cas system Type II protein with McrA/HNH and RuvC-like nuclease domain